MYCESSEQYNSKVSSCDSKVHMIFLSGECMQIPTTLKVVGFDKPVGRIQRLRAEVVYAVRLDIAQGRMSLDNVEIAAICRGIILNGKETYCLQGAIVH